METTRKEWLNPKEVSKEYKISISILAKWRMERKHLPFSKVGKYIKYKRADVEAFLNSHRVEVVNGGAI